MLRGERPLTWPLEARGDGPVDAYPLAWPIALTCLFATLVTLISLTDGVALPLPTEKVSPALGFNAMFPLLVALGGYLCVRAWQLAGAEPVARRELVGRLRIDLTFLALFVIATYFHFVLKLQIPLIRSSRYDDVFFLLDDRVASVIGALTELRNTIARALPHSDSWYQLCQLSVYVLSFWGHAFGNRHWFQRVMTAFLLNVTLGAFAYLLAPAIGPFVYESGPNLAAIQAQQVMANVADEVSSRGAMWLAPHGSEFFTSAPASMPSLHVSIACIAAYYAIRARLPLPLQMVIIPMAVWIPLEAVVSRWHYLADVPAGILFAFLVIMMSERLCGHPKSGMHVTRSRMEQARAEQR